MTWKPPPGGVLGLPTPSPAPTRFAPEVIGSAPADLRTVNWSNTSLPAAFCGVSGLTSFHNGTAAGASREWGQVELNVIGTAIVYGDLDGDGRAEAAIALVCSNGGGTAAGDLAFAYLVLAEKAGRLEVLGTITPQDNPSGVHVTSLAPPQISRGKITVEESWYRPSDADCCPSGRATTQWTWGDQGLVAGVPDIVSGS